MLSRPASTCLTGPNDGGGVVAVVDDRGAPAPGPVCARADRSAPSDAAANVVAAAPRIHRRSWFTLLDFSDMHSLLLIRAHASSKAVPRRSSTNDPQKL